MKLKRYDVSDDNYRSGYSENNRGDWCMSADVDALEAEHEALCAEIERLKAPPKVLSAEEVSEEGYYWYRLRETDEWLICEYSDRDKTFFTQGDSMFTDCPEFGQFIGPLTPPEV